MARLPILIRAFQADDAQHLPCIMHAAARSTAPRHYSAQQAEAWSPSPASAAQFLARIADDRLVFVATSPDNGPLGFIELERNGHIDCFYCHPDWIGKGIGARLYQKVVEQALALGIYTLRVEASEAAREFFLRRGFLEIRRQTLARRGVILHNYVMTKSLGTTDQGAQSSP